MVQSALAANDRHGGQHGSRLAGLDRPVPDYSMLCRRQKTSAVQISYHRAYGPLNLPGSRLIDRQSQNRTVAARAMATLIMMVFCSVPGMKGRANEDRQIINAAIELVVATIEKPDRHPEIRLFPCRVIERRTLRKLA